MSSQQPVSKDNLSLLLPYYLDKTFSEIFREIGFEVFWADNRADTEKVIIENEPDLAIEWRYGDDDFPIRDLLRKYRRRTPIFLALNWGGPLPDPGEIGCTGYIDVPFKMMELMDLFYKALPERKRSLVKKMCDSLNTDLFKLNTSANVTCKTILVVDHNDIMLEVIEKMLEHIGYEALLALSCPEAIDIYKKHQKRIAAVVTTLVMPEMNGIELIEWLHGQDPSLPIILTSGYEPGLKEFSQSSLAQSPLIRTIMQPFSVTEISECLQELLNVGFYMYDNGVKFVGEIENGLPNGQGTLIFPEGGGYIGQFKKRCF